MEVIPRPVTFEAADGTRLAGTQTPSRAPRAAVVIAGAMGVAHRFYLPFAAALAERGLSTVAFDYRGVGASRPATLKGYDASVHAWGEQDLAAAIQSARRWHPGLPIAVVGHSVGGQLLGLLPESAAIAAAVTLGAQSGYWKLWPGPRKWLMWGLWHVVIPTLVPAFGRLPMRAVRQGEDLPAGVAAEWARWGRHPEYILSHPGAKEGFARFGRPLRAYAIADDGYAPPPSVERLFEAFGSKDKELRILEPRALGVRRIGHFGALRPQLRDAVWDPIASWLLDVTRADARADA